MTKRISLGKGLSALFEGKEIPIVEQNKSTDSASVSIGKIVPNRFQPRTQFNAESIQSLAESIKTRGLLQPVVVRRLDSDRYELVCGERRLRAAKEASLGEVPVLIKDVTDAEALELALIENLQREDLNPLDEAKGYQMLMEKFGLSHKEIGEKVGRDRTTVINTLRLLGLDDKVKQWVLEGRLTQGHARALLALDSKEEQRKWADEILAHGLSVREVEERIYGPKRLVKRKLKAKASGRPDPDLGRMTQALERKFGTRVRIRTSARKGGRIEIEYYSLDDFERIINILGIQP
ncbi:MAG: ParB/RepB/Spo0J family partition protein [Candidatus Omnitrophica bacterium]|nr:ParB/RepB/Spo0J family partition protein [Candidatus Omnitrophota bacterium]